MVDWHGDACGLDVGLVENVQRRIRGKRGLTQAPRQPEAPGDEAASRPGAADLAVAEADTVLLVAELNAGGGLQLGDEVAAGPNDENVGAKVIARRADGRPVLCERVPYSQVEEWRAGTLANAGRLVGAQPGPAEPPAIGEAARGGPQDALLDQPEGAGGGTATPRADVGAAADDVRTSSVEWNEQGIRFKEWRRAVGESSTEALDGCELRGAGTALHLCQRFTQHGGDPKTWMSNFCREYGITQRDRTYHELNCLITIFWLAGTFDALNLGGLACLEVAARRVAQISEAYRVAPGQPAAWEAGRFLTGTSDPYDVVSPELRNFANRAARDEAERLTAIGRSRGLGPGGRGAGGVEDVGAALDAGGLPRAGAPDGSGAKGGGGRGRGAKVKPGDAAAAAVKP